jgi:general stress protein 26
MPSIGLWLIAALLQPAAATPARIQAAAFDVMKVARYCTLITIGEGGHPQARIVDPLIAEAEGSIWIATNPRSRKVREIEKDPRVTLTFFNAAANEYVTVLGRAAAVTDSARKAAHWKPEWQPFYKQESRGADFMLFEVRPFQLEVSSSRHKMANDDDTWRPVILKLPAASQQKDDRVAARERYLRAEENQQNDLVITKTTGERIRVPRTRGANNDETQEEFGDIAVSADGSAVGWLAYYPNCCTSYPIPLLVEIYTGGERKSFSPAIAAWDWCFVDGADKLAAMSMTVHGPQHQILELWDVRSGAKLEALTWMQDQTLPDAPAWAVALRREHARPREARTHRCTTATQR